MGRGRASPDAARGAGRTAVGAALLALLVTLVWYGPGLAMGRVLIPADLLELFTPWSADSDLERPINGLLGDQVQQMYPWRVFVHQELAAGRFPLWNPLSGGGVPLFANGQSAVLFPLNVGTLWMDPAWAATTVQLAKPPLAAAGTALFMRALGVGALAAAFAALGWGFAGPMVTWLGWPHTNALALVPFLFWTATRWLQTSGWRWWTAHAVTLALQLFGGHPETTAHTVFVLGVFLACWLGADVLGRVPPQGTTWRAGTLGRNLARALRLLLGWGLAIGGGAALAAVQVVPLLEAIGYSIQAAERSSGAQSRIVLEPETVVTWLVPSFFGTPLAHTFGQLSYLNYNETLGYVGIGTLALALTAVAAHDRRPAVGLLALTIISLGLTYGWPVLTELRRLPGLGHAANTRFVFLAAFGLACLAGLGLDACLRQRRSPWPVYAVAGCVGLVALGATALALSPDRLLPTAEGAAPLTPLEAAVWRQGELWKTAGLAVGWMLVFLLTRLAGRRQAVAGALCVGLLVVDLSLFGSGYNPMVPLESVHRVPEAIRLVQTQGGDGRVISIGDGLLPNAAMLYGLADLRVYEPVAHWRMLRFFEEVDRGIRTDVRNRFYLFTYDPVVNLLSLGSVRWVFQPRWDPKLEGMAEKLAGQGLILRHTDRATNLWENPYAVPRAYLAREVIRVLDAPAALSWAAAWSPQVAGQVVVESEAELPAGPEGGVITGLRSWPGGAEVEVSVPAGGFLVLNDTRYPGWEASIDGQPVSIWQTNYLFMGIALPPGDHVVRLAYRPPTVGIGLGISLVSLLALGVSIAVRARFRAVGRVA